VAKAPQLLAVTWNKGVVISATGGGATGGNVSLGNDGGLTIAGAGLLVLLIGQWINLWRL